MTAGFPSTWNGGHDEIWAQPDVVAACLASATHAPGEQFAYSDPGAHLVGAILARATGRSMLAYAREKLFGPLGIDTADPAAELLAVPENLDAYDAAKFSWPVDPQGIQYASGSLKLTPADMAKLGTLFLQDGKWEGRQIVSKEWVRRATTTHVNAVGATTHYGYLWWVGGAGEYDSYFAWGYGGQLIQVVPALHLVVAASTEVGDKAPSQAIQRLTEDAVIPALVDDES
jgi:CubicO group peptidase (beta-lactamase class C family)